MWASLGTWLSAVGRQQKAQPRSLGAREPWAWGCPQRGSPQGLLSEVPTRPVDDGELRRGSWRRRFSIPAFVVPKGTCCVPKPPWTTERTATLPCGLSGRPSTQRLRFLVFLWGASEAQPWALVSWAGWSLGSHVGQIWQETPLGPRDLGWESPRSLPDPRGHSASLLPLLCHPHLRRPDRPPHHLHTALPITSTPRG